MEGLFYGQGGRHVRVLRQGEFRHKIEVRSLQDVKAAVESNQSHCSGFDVPSFQPAKPAPQVQGNAPVAPSPQAQPKPSASGQPDPAEDRKFNEQKGALLRTIRIPDSGDAPQGPSISPSRFVTPDMCRQAERDREKLRSTLAGLQERSRSLDLPCAEAISGFMLKRWKRCRRCSESPPGCSTWARRQRKGRAGISERIPVHPDGHGRVGCRDQVKRRRITEIGDGRRR